MALKRVHSIEKKIDENSHYAEQYCKKIYEYTEKGYAVKQTDEEIRTRQTKYYLPDLAVMNENKPGKIRFVFDAASKSCGLSLNDMLLSGLDLPI